MEEVVVKRFFGWVALAAIGLAPVAASAGGFNIYEMGARATALGGAFTATADDGSAIFYNPAGLSWLNQGWHASGNLALIRPTSKYARADGLTSQAYPGSPTAETKDRTFPPAGAYLSYRANAKWAFGLGFFTPFGLGVDWDQADTFAGRKLATNSEIQGYYISPVVSFRPNEEFALAAGFHAVITHLTLQRILVGGTNLDTNLGDIELSGSSDIAYAPAFALMVRPREDLSFGVNFKGGVTNKFDQQDASLSNRFDQSVTTDKVSGELDYPSILSFGARYQATERLAVMLDYVWMDWSVFDEVKLTFSEGNFPTTVLEEKYDDGDQWRMGAEYQYSPSLSFMVGYVRDHTPQPRFSMSPLLPDADRNDYSLGITYRRSGYEFTVGYMLVDFNERSTVENGQGTNLDGFDGTYDSIAHIPTFGVSKSF
jgi:long-chain fatty acid transport protein